ncbi:MAG: hypothetical protein PHW69_09430, partial [Elusimicrobiaceae bacterium]|nr:hypothetical protein [Elusimicrobiaceae bacterium]
MTRLFFIVLISLLAGCTGNMRTASTAGPGSDELAAEAENVGYYVPVFRQLEAEEGDFAAIARKIRALDSGIFTA